MTTPPFSTFDGTKLLFSASDLPSRCDRAWIVQVRIAGFCSASDRLGFVRSRHRSKHLTNKSVSIEDICKTSTLSDDEKLKFHSLERSCGKRFSYQESKRREIPRKEESGRVFFSGRHMDCVQKETHVVFSHEKLVQRDLYGGQRREERPSPPAPDSKAKTDEGRGKSSKTYGNKKKARQARVENYCESPSCRFSTTSLRPDSKKDESLSDRSLAKSQRKVVRNDHFHC